MQIITLGGFLFAAFVFFIIVYGTNLSAAHLWYKYDLAVSSFKFTGKELIAHDQYLKSLEIAINVFGVFNIVVMGCNIFCLYNLTVKQDLVRYYIHSYNLIYVIAGFICIWDASSVLY